MRLWTGRVISVDYGRGYECIESVIDSGWDGDVGLETRVEVEIVDEQSDKRGLR